MIVYVRNMYKAWNGQERCVEGTYRQDVVWQAADKLPLALFRAAEDRESVCFLLALDGPATDVVLWWMLGLLSLFSLVFASPEI